MGYCALEDMEKLIPPSMLINLSNDTPGQSSVDQDNIDEAIDQADREIDSYLSIAGISVPVDPVPPLITNLSTKMAIWNLHLRKYFDSTIWRETYKDCQRLLERIATGKLSLGQIEEGLPTEPSSGFSSSSRTQKFTEDFMEQF